MTDDIIDRIDAQLAAGEPETGYDFNDPTYPRCPRCGRHWHGLTITRRIDWMYRSGRFDPDYTVAGDDSEILCEGSEFIGPRRPTDWERDAADAWGGYTQHRARGAIAFRIVFDEANAASFRRGLREMRDHFQQVAERFQRLNTMTSWPNPWIQQTTYSMYVAPFDGKPAPLCLSSAPSKIRFGPENWGPRTDAATLPPPPRHQFPRIAMTTRYGAVTWSGYADPLSRGVSDLWPQFTALEPHLAPPRPGYDFTSYKAEPNNGPPQRRRRTTTAHLPHDNWAPQQRRTGKRRRS